MQQNGATIDTKPAETTATPSEKQQKHSCLSHYYSKVIDFFEKERKPGETEWPSLVIAGLISLFATVQFTIYFPSLWPFMLQIDPNASEQVFGYINAANSLGTALFAPVFGWWSAKINQTRLPILVGISIMTFGNLLYMLAEVLPFDYRYVLFLARFINGSGSGYVTVLKTYSINASNVKDRSRSISLNNGCFAMGITLGPALQIFFMPLQYPGVNIFGFNLSIYTAPAMFTIFLNAFCIVVLCTIFRESTVGITPPEHKVDNEEHHRFFALPKYNWVGVLVCVFTRALQMFIVANFDTVSSPLSMTMFNWTKADTVRNNALMHLGFGILSFLIYAAATFINFGKYVNHRIIAFVGVCGIALFHLITFPWWGIQTKITYQQQFELLANGTRIPVAEPVGCRPSYEWCAYTPAINQYLYMITYVLVFASSFSLINVSMNTVYSMILGPRNQGMMQGLMMFAGSVARMGGPVFVATLFTNYGPRPTWAIEIVASCLCAASWIIFHRQLVPLKLPHTLSAGDVFRNKHGMVYKF